LGRSRNGCSSPRSRLCCSRVASRDAKLTNMANFEEIDEARRTLELGETASLKEIKKAYRNMAFRYHPDRGGTDSESEEMMKRLNRSYRLLMAYCARFHYTFREEDVARAYPEEEYLRRWQYYGP
jgi:hypothetical protein